MMSCKTLLVSLSIFGAVCARTMVDQKMKAIKDLTAKDATLTKRLFEDEVEGSEFRTRRTWMFFLLGVVLGAVMTVVGQSIISSRSSRDPSRTL